MLPVQALMPKDATLIRRTTTASVAPILNTSRSSRVRNCKSWGFFSSFSSITVSDMLVKTGAKTCQHIHMFALLGDPLLLAFNAPWWLWWLWAKDPKHWGQDFRAITGVVAPRQHTDENGKCQHKEDVLNVAPQGIANGHFSTTLPSGRTQKKCRGLVMKSSLICIYLPEKKKIGSLWQHLILYIYRKNVGNIRELLLLSSIIGDDFLLFLVHAWQWQLRPTDLARRFQPQQESIRESSSGFATEHWFC